MFVDLPVNDFEAAETSRIDDAGVIEPVAVNHIAIKFAAQLLIDDSGEKSFVCGETGRVKDRVFHPEKFGNLFFQLSMNRLGSAQKPHGRDSMAEFANSAQ